MTRWKKDAKEFNVSINKLSNKDGSETQICRIPRPITKMLGNPNKIKFIIHNKKILVTEGDKYE